MADPRVVVGYRTCPLPVADLAYAAVWPKRLAWRVADWCTTGWPNEPVQLCDSIVDLTQPCDW
jgi:hypothetical protein